MSDTQLDGSWNLPTATSGKPRDRVRIQVWDLVSGSYSTAYVGGPSRTSYTYNSAEADNRYRLRVRAENDAGSSDWAYSGYVPTRPAPAADLVAVRSGTDISVTWDIVARYNTGLKFAHSEDGGAWNYDLATLAADTTSYTHVGPDPAKTHQYAVAMTADGRQSEWAYSAVVQLLTNPLAPTPTAPLDAFDGASVMAFYWVHNPVDGTAQTAYEIQYRVDGGDWTSTGKLAGSSFSHEFAGGTFANGATLEWQVRTWGEYATEPSESPWSETVLLEVSSTPTVNLTTPADAAVVETSSLTAAWSYGDAEASSQTGWAVVLYSAADAALETLQGTDDAASAVFETYLKDGASYSVGVAVRDGAGLWSAEDRNYFTVDYAEPPAPAVTANFDVDTGAMMITIDTPDAVAPAPEAEYVDLYRAIDDGPWTLIATNLPKTTALTDYIPALVGVNHYRAVSVSALPSTAESLVVQVVVDAGEGWCYLNAGPGFSVVARVRANAKRSRSFSREKVLHEFAGRTHPVEFAGEHRRHTGSLAVRVSPNPDGGATLTQLRRVVDLPAPVCYRDPLGERIFVSLQELADSSERIVTDANFSWTEVSHHE
ncbi:fibronectin type III domain-containing protein [Zhihengliuella halotolerans]|uniref:glycoside hydrolase family 78 protein n=1 Tax=Zhihengliuella halotolerans TaxID=370736 RepID=UPI0013EE4286|nr:fibronectin type III domain-containing protein [Zhihengliuella halotolerans]